MKVLVTGATGFVGQEVVQALYLYHDVRVLVRDPNSPVARRLATEYSVTLQPGNVLDEPALRQAMHGTDAVIHLVGIIGEHGDQTFENMHKRATENVVRAALIVGTRRIVHMSALGTRPNARARYHQSKWAAEQAVSQCGLNWTIFRPSIIYGPNDHFVNLFADLARRHPVLPVFGEGKAQLQPVPVGDVARCFAGALREPRSYRETYDICGPERFTMPELLQIICAAIGKKKRIVHVPMGMAQTLVSFLEFYHAKFLKKPPPLSRDQLLMLEEDNVGDPRWTVEMFNLRPASFADGIAEYVKRKA